MKLRPVGAKATLPRGSGFTLVELLIAVALVAILGAIALPSYAVMMRRAQRQDARLAVLEVQHALERHYLRHFAYTDRITEPRDAGGLGHRGQSRSGDYRLTVTLRNEGQGYVVEAVPEPQGRQSADRQCMRFSVDETGRRGATDDSGGDSTSACWR